MQRALAVNEQEIYKEKCDFLIKNFFNSNKILGNSILSLSKMSHILKLLSLVAVKEKNTLEFIREVVKIFSIDYELNMSIVLPNQGATVFVSNHPTGFKETIALTEILLSVRPDLKIIANEFLPMFPQTEDLILKADVFSESTSPQNITVLRSALTHLKNGGALLIFPAGSVGVRKKNKIIDKKWNRSFSAMALKTKSNIIAINVQAKNPIWFYHLDKIHPMLRTLFMPRMLFNPEKIKIKIDTLFCPDGKSKEEVVRIAYEASNS
jgi:putative hemolysin